MQYRVKKKQEYIDYYVRQFHEHGARPEKKA
jgi:hypothetical protein